MQRGVGMHFWHGGYVGAARPGAQASAWDDRNEPVGIMGQEVVAGKSHRAVADGRRFAGYLHWVPTTNQVHLQKALDARKSFEDQLVAGVKLDAWLAINALGPKFRTKLALGFGAIAPRLAGPADFAL